MIEPGSLVFFKDPKQSWVLGTVDTWDGTFATCKSKSNPNHVLSKLKNESLFVTRDDTINEDVNDLLQLTILHDATLLRTLQIRYLRDVIYTNIGAIVVAFNPFNFKIPAYGDAMMPAYLGEGDRIEKNLPHSWAVAHNTFYEMRNDMQNQCILVSGESGAGKTEASKIVMKYLAAISCLRGVDSQKASAANVGQKINATSPILEAFGNGKTVRNDNSSRFGKFMRVKFDTGGFLIGAYITKYLLEKSRIVTACANERLYHAFYLVVRGKDSATLGCKNEREWRTLGSGGCYNNKEFDTEAAYDEVVNSMKFISLTDAQIRAVWSTVAGILSLGNLDFVSNGEGSTIAPTTAPYTTNSAKLWQIEDSVLCQELVTTTLSIGGKLITKLLNPTMAMDCRDALVKGLYDNTFAWLVDRCNAILDVATDGDSNWIGLLDIFGFEDFESNSFEQVCINLANETLQNHYNNYIFTKDMDECRAEGVNVSEIIFPDNGPCMDLMMGKGGVLAMLDEECTLGQGTDEAFLTKLEQAKGSHAFFGKKKLSKSTFIIKHYAGDVNYTVTGFLEKNRDTLKDAFKNLLRASTDGLIKTLLPEPIENAKKITVGGYFKTQLRDLMDLINTTNPHWIRCVKPHPAKKPLMFDGQQTMNQLESSGVLGTVKIRKAGYPVRIAFEDFNARYYIVVKAAGKGTSSVGGTTGSGTSQTGKKLRARFQVEEGAKASRENKKFKEAVEALFKTVDPDGTGSMDSNNLKDVLQSLGEPCDPASSKRIEKEMDTDNSGSIDYEEFFVAMMNYVNRGYIVEEKREVDEKVEKKDEKKTPTPAAGGRDIAKLILSVIPALNEKLAQIGKTRVFLKSEGYVEIEKAKKAALAQSAKVVLAFAKTLVDMGEIKRTVMESNKVLNERLRVAARYICELQTKETAERVALFQSHCGKIDAAAQQLMDEGADLFAKLLAEQEERRKREEERRARAEAEKVEALRLRKERTLASDLRKAEEEAHRKQLAEVQDKALKERETRILSQVGELAKAVGHAEKKLRDRIQEQAEAEDAKRRREEERRHLVSERRTKHIMEEKKRETALLKALTAKQFEVDLQRAQTDIRKVREVEKKKLQNTLRRTNAIVKEQEEKLLDTQWRCREAESLQVRQEILSKSKELKAANGKALAHQAFLERESLKRRQAATAAATVSSAHSVLARQARNREAFHEKVGDVSSTIRLKTIKEEAEMKRDGEAMLASLKQIAAHTQKVLSPERTVQVPIKPRPVHFDVLTVGVVPSAVVPIDSYALEKLMGEDKYRHIVVPKPQVVEEVSLHWKP